MTNTKELIEKLERIAKNYSSDWQNTPEGVAANHLAELEKQNIRLMKVADMYDVVATRAQQLQDKCEGYKERIYELEQRERELVAHVERLRFIADTEYADEDERIADIHGVLESTPQQSLAEREAEVARKAFAAGVDWANSLQPIDPKITIVGAATEYAERVKRGEA